MEPTIGGPWRACATICAVNDARAADAVDHLQAAALELIEATRAFLDVLEDFIGDRERFAEVADIVGAAASAAARVAHPGGESSPAERSRVERIAVS